MKKIIIDWKEYFDNGCKGEDMWGHYKTSNGDLYVVADGVSNHDGTKTGKDVVRLLDDRLKQDSGNIRNRSDCKEFIHSINTESTKENEGAYAAIAGILHKENKLYGFSAGDISIIARKANGKLIQVLPLDLNMHREEAEKHAKAEIGQTVNNIKITKENYQQRINQYMNHGLSNAIGLGEDFFLHEKNFNAREETAMVIASDGITDPFMNPQNEAGKIFESDAAKIYEIFRSSSNAEDSVIALENVLWDTQVTEKKKIKADDRTGLFLYINSVEEISKKEQHFNSQSNKQLAMELARKIEEHKLGSVDLNATISISDLEEISKIANELLQRISNDSG
jgi:hypothetical protein